MFKILAVRPLKGCGKHIRKCLEEGQMYYFCDDFVITEGGIALRDGHAKPLPNNFFGLSGSSGLEVNISAVVGMNGDGKSSLIELMMRLLNNCAKHYKLADKENLLRIQEVKAELYYLLDNVVYCIRESQEDKYTSLLKYADISNRKTGQWKRLMTPVKGVKNLNELFFTIVSNYSHYAYNTKDFREEWQEDLTVDEESEKCWLHYLFHKNDGYLTPMTIHPYRYEGDIDVNREANLAMQRLTSLYIQEPNPKENGHSFRRIGEKDAEILSLTDAGSSNLQEKTIIEYFKNCKSISVLDGTIKKLEENIKQYVDKIGEDLHDDQLEVVEQCLDLLTGANDKLYQNYLRNCLQWIKKQRRGRVFSSNSDIRLLLKTLQNYEEQTGNEQHYAEFTRKYNEFGKFNVAQLIRLRFIYVVMKRWIISMDCLFDDYSDLMDIQKCQHYIVYKTIDICRTYPKYRNLMDENDRGWNNPGLVLRDHVIYDVTQLIEEDVSHVTLKLRQCLNFIDNLKLHGGNVYEQLDGKGIPQKLREEYQGALLVRFNDLKAHFKKDPFPLDQLPPAIYKAEILYQSNKKSDDYMPYRFLSSGEKQLLNNIGALIYHLRNLDSVEKDNFQYETINVLLEEIELYFHPEYQRMLVKMLLEKLYAIQFKLIKRINITFVTHSPFILSDIPKNNVLLLEKGVPIEEKKKKELTTFGANIYDMLKTGFFLKEPVGDFAKYTIDLVAGSIRGKEVNKLSKDEIRECIEMIDEPIVKRILIEEYTKLYDKDLKRRYLEEELRKLENKE